MTLLCRMLGHKRGQVIRDTDWRSTCTRCGINLVKESGGWKSVALARHKRGFWFHMRRLRGSISCQINRHAPALQEKRWVNFDDGKGTYVTRCSRCAAILRRSQQVWLVVREDAAD
jgi:hypothetical protein